MGVFGTQIGSRDLRYISPMLYMGSPRIYRSYLGFRDVTSTMVNQLGENEESSMETGIM